MCAKILLFKNICIIWVHRIKDSVEKHCGYSKDCHGPDKWVFCPIWISPFITELPLFHSLFYNFVLTTKEIKAPKFNALKCNSDLTTQKQRVTARGLSEFIPLALLDSPAFRKYVIAHATCIAASKRAESGELGILFLVSFFGNGPTYNTILRHLTCLCFRFTRQYNEVSKS